MTIIDLKTQIMKNEIQNFYIFTGTEIGIINIYLEQMSAKLGMPITRADSVLSIYENCTSRTIFGSTTGFYVIRNDNDFTKQENAYTTIQKDIGKNVIVLLYEKLDSRLKFGKFFKDQTINFEKLNPNILSNYIKKSINLSDRNIEVLMSVCNNSYDMCMLEIDKIKQYQESSKDKAGSTYTADHCFEYLLNDGTIYQPEESDVFQFTNAVCSKNFKEALRLEKILRLSGTQSITLLGTLYNSLKTLMLIQCCPKGQNISEVTGLDNKIIYVNKKFEGRYATPRLVNAVQLISTVVDGIKNGLIEDEYATRYVLANL